MTRPYHCITALEQARIVRGPDAAADLDFLRGAAIVAAPETPWWFDLEQDTTPLPHLLGGRIPLASERLLRVLADAGADNVQAFPAVLRLRNGTEWRQHAVLNVIGLIDATDLDASVGTILAEGDRGPTRVQFDRLVLSPARTRGLPIFRLFHDPATLLVDARVMHALVTHRPDEGWGFFASEIEVSG